MSFQCGVCNDPFDKNEEAILHMESIHPKETGMTTPPSSPNPTVANQLYSPEVEIQLQEEEDVMEAAKEEQDLYDALDNITKDIIQPEKEAGVREDLKEKLERYKNIMVKKNHIIKENMDTLKRMKLNIEAVKHDAAMLTEIKERQSNRIAEAKEELNNISKKYAKTEKEKEAIIKDMETTKELNSSLNKEVNDLEMQLQVKDGIVKALKETFAVDEEVIVVANTRKETPCHSCNACGKNFRQSQDLEKHMEDKHSEHPCIYCEKEFSSKASLEKHHKACTRNIGVSTSICNKCSLKFTNQGLKRHEKNCQGSKKEFDCPDCGMIFESSNAVDKHQGEEHEYEPVRSRIVCKHWRKGNCHKGDRCGYSHVGHQQNSNTRTTSRNTTKVPECLNGSSCEWLSKGNCSYFHPRIGVQKPWASRDRVTRTRQDSINSQGGRTRQDSRTSHGARTRQVSRTSQEAGGRGQPRPGSQSDRATCRFDGRCERIPNCPYLHYKEDFPPLQVRRNTVRGGQQIHRRN